MSKKDEKLKRLQEQESKDRETISKALTVMLELDELVADLKAQIADLTREKAEQQALKGVV